MKNYSFSNITNEQSYATRKSNDFSNLYRHSELKSSEANQRIEEIKKKYDTPSRRERIDSLKKSKDSEILARPPIRQDTKDSVYHHRAAPTFGNNHLKQSFAVNRLEKSTLKNDIEGKDFMNLRMGDREYRRPTDKENDYLPYRSGNREEEDAIFSKVREMKESIINNDYMKTSINGRASISSAKFSQYAENKYQSKKQFDPRVENIDKINSKIKQILSCLSENQKNPSKYLKEPSNTATSYMREGNTPSVLREQTGSNKESAFFGNKVREISDSKRSFQSHFHKGSDVVQKYNIFDKPIVEQPKELPKTSFAQQPRSGSKVDALGSKSTLDYKQRNRDYSINRVETYNNKEYSISRPFKKEEELTRTPNYLNKDFSNLKGSRSRSQIDSFKKSTIGNNQNSDMLKSGKKLNDEISKIQKKIQDFQKEKRKLNIEFTPFTLKNKSSANLNASVRPQKSREEVKPEEQSRNSTKNIDERSSSTDFKFKSYMNRASAYEQKYGDFANKSKDSINKQITKNTSIYDNVKPRHSEGDFELKIQQIQVKTVRIENNIDANQEESINYEQSVEFDSAAIKKRTDQGIQQRRRRLQGGESAIITTQSLKKIVSLFCEQVKLDESFRNMKIWLETCFQSDKFNKIMKNLQKDGVKMTLKECQAIFTVDQSEHNPFFTVQGFEGSYNSLISAYLQADRHWKTQILNKFDKNNLISEGFTSQKIDLERKGFIQLQDLVRFLNIQSGTFYRNRDLFLIFNRFSSGERLNFQQMIGNICA